MLWALAILAYKGTSAYRQTQQLEQDFIGLPEERAISTVDARGIALRIQQLPDGIQRTLLPRALTGAIERFASTRNVQDAATEVNDLCDQESDRLESELSIIRYIAWAIPSVGFIGTVRGIGDALAQAHRAVEGDITGVTQSLGVAFNSTFIALVISIVLMFIIHQIQLMQDRLVLDSKSYCSKWLVRRLTRDSRAASYDP
jgi:biopolymer transport protein ExbB/TolQ